jgi:hypothetical protein
MAPLMNAPSVIPQLILNLCTISIAMCTKFFDQMTPFNGDKIRPRLTAKAGGKTFLWLFHTGASITCMTKASFNAAFLHQMPPRVQSSQHCTAASCDKLNSLGIYEIDLLIKGKKFTYNINVMDTLTNNIVLIDFMHKNKLHYDVQTRQLKIAGIEGDQIVAIKNKSCQLSLPQWSQPNARANQKKNVHFIASIFAPKNPMLTGMPAVVTVDKNNNCKIVIDNCAPYIVTIDRNDILALMDRETEQLQPLEDSVISAILTDIDKKLPQVPKRKLTKAEIAKKLI